MTAPGLCLIGRAHVGGATLFQKLNFECAGGSWTCLLGPSGVGKTTILRLVAGLETGVAFDGSIKATDGAPLPERIAYMGQTDLLFPWLDVRQNVLLGARLRGDSTDPDRAQRLIERVGLSADGHKRPGQLSGGMRQRVALARTLMEDRPILLLDEPFSALDAKTRAEMQELTAELLVGRTVLLITHDPAEAARLGHSIALMSKHGLAWIEPPSSEPIRAYDDADVFDCQSRLMSLIREAA